MIKIAILGFGSRGRLYADFALEQSEKVQIVAVCDTDPKKKAVACGQYGISESMFFDDYKQMYQLGKIADVLVIATLDGDHFKHAVPALEMGYDILLEKPISNHMDECVEIASIAKKMGRKVAVAHVLRYTSFYGKIKNLIDEGRVGTVVTINQTENVAYWHQAHSFVRGNWRNAEENSPMILQKCCHDLDIIRWLIGKRCKKISSFGGLYYFTPEHKPVGAADHCVDCKVDCVYNCLDFYKTHPSWLRFISLDTDAEKVLSDRNNPYSRCVFSCDNDVVDHQVVNMLFEDGMTAQLTMTAFSKDCRRTIKIHGTEGEIVGDMEEEKITLTRYGECGFSNYSEVFDFSSGVDISGHGGGDKKLFNDFIDLVSGEQKAVGLTDIETSLESHIMAFMAEKSRLNGGAIESVSDS